MFIFFFIHLHNQISTIRFQKEETPKNSLERNRPAVEMKPTELNDLPELPLEAMFGYLSLSDLIKFRLVSRRWCKTIDSLKMKSLFYSKRPIGFVHRNTLFVRDAFAQNFIATSRFNAFFDTFGQSMLSSLKRIGLSNLRLSAENETAFARTLNSFAHLEQLGLFYFGSPGDPDEGVRLELNLPELESIWLEEVAGIKTLVLNSPKLRNVKLVCSSARLDIVDGQSVERLITDDHKAIPMTKLTNLKYLYGVFHSEIESTPLSSLEQLKELHLSDHEKVTDYFEQAKRYRRTDLKIFYFGLHLTGPNDPARHPFSSFYFLKSTALRSLVENPSRQAGEMPLYRFAVYAAIEHAAPHLQATLLSRLPDLTSVSVLSSLQDVERFLNFLKKFKQIVELRFSEEQPQSLFDRLPDYCAVQSLSVKNSPPESDFLFRCQNLIELTLNWSIGVEFIKRVFDELKFIQFFRFKYANKDVTLQVDQNGFLIWLKDDETIAPDLNTAVQFLMDNTK